MIGIHWRRIENSLMEMSRKKKKGGKAAKRAQSFSDRMDRAKRWLETYDGEKIWGKHHQGVSEEICG